MILLGKIISWLVTPVTLLVVLSLIAWYKRRTPVAKNWLGATVFTWVFFTNPMVINTVFRWWEGRPEPLEAIEKSKEQLNRLS